MKNSLDSRDRRSAMRIIAVYALFAAAWIYLSDQAMGIFIHDREMMVRISVYKGFLFITVTSILLYLLIARNIIKTRLMEKELLKSQKLTNSLLEGTSDAVYLKDREGRYILLNRAAAEFAGKPVEELIGRVDSEIVSCEDAASLMKLDRMIMGECKVMTVEDRFTTADDVNRIFLSTKGPLLDDRGEVAGLFGISRDITSLRLSEQELREKREELERFTYMISHDLKSPLITIKTFLGYLRQDLDRSERERVAEDMRHMSEAADKAGRLLDELLEMSRIGRSAKSPVRTSFRELVDEAVTMVAGQVSMRGVEVRTGSGDAVLSGDPERLVALWQNLVDNAVKYMGEQRSPLVEIGLDGSGPETSFFVLDNGMGIAREDLEKVFGLCVKLDPASEGTGLGLAMARKIVEMYGGTIRAESDGPGHGSCFRFTLPDTLRGAEKLN